MFSGLQTNISRDRNAGNPPRQAAYGGASVEVVLRKPEESSRVQHSGLSARMPELQLHVSHRALYLWMADCVQMRILGEA